MKTELQVIAHGGETFRKSDLIDSSIAVATPKPLARKLTYSLGALYGMFVWSVAEGFGGSYRRGTPTDVGAAIIYSLLLGALLLVAAGRFTVTRLAAVRSVPS